MAYSDTTSTILNFLSNFTDNKMISQILTVQNKSITILLQYIVFLDTYHALHGAHFVTKIPVRHFLRSDIFTVAMVCYFL